MLCRVAESLYWIARYIERAENLVRFLKVGWAVSLDTEHPSASQWLSLVDGVPGPSCPPDRERFGSETIEGLEVDVQAAVLA